MYKLVHKSNKNTVFISPFRFDKLAGQLRWINHAAVAGRVFSLSTMLLLLALCSPLAQRKCNGVSYNAFFAENILSLRIGVMVRTEDRRRGVASVPCRKSKQKMKIMS